MARTALIVAVPEAEPVVGEWRERFDNARLGVPAHITLLFPFVPLEKANESLIEELRELFASEPAISFSLTDLAVFPDETIWLTPEPSAPFRRLTERIVEAYPDYPPYEGIHDEVIPHLTVTSGDADLLAEVERSLAPHLPVAATTREVTLLAEDEAGFWSPAGQLPLATESGSRPAG